MKSKIGQLNSIELRVYAEISYASQNGICGRSINTMRHRCELSPYFYKKTLSSLEEKRFISQELGYGVTRKIHLINENMNAN